MTLEVIQTKAPLILGSLWKLLINIDAFKDQYSDELVTQASIGRVFQLIDLMEIDFKEEKIIDRVKVRLLEDDYICWFKFSQLTNNASKIKCWDSRVLTQEEIASGIPKILSWAMAAKGIDNKYLWGGTIGPDYDCSGFVQAAFVSSGIWIPRDAYQQETFCQKVASDINSVSEKLIPGDLVFFGSTDRCTHVGLHIEDGFYVHSSGVSNGHNGIEIDSLWHPGEISSFYRSKFRSAGRVTSSYRGKALTKIN